jgi:predicted DNA-binding transcriptional regulator YafY
VDEDARSGKRDRLARITRVVSLLRAHPDGMAIKDIARRIDVSVRTVYRDLNAIEGEIGIAVWSDGGNWGLAADEFLPPLKLTQDEAMAVVLSARLMVRYADKYDPELGSAFEKLGDVLPAALKEHVSRTLDVLSRHPKDERFGRHVSLLTKAWAERRIVALDYEPARYGPDSTPRAARVRPYLIEPSLQTHALYLVGWDETRDAIRTFKVERIRDVSITPETFAAPEEGVVENMFSRAWDIIADQELVDVVVRFSPAVAARVQEARWHPSQAVETEADGSIVWRARIAGTIEVRLWILQWGDDAEVLEPASLRDSVAATHRRAAERYGAPSSGR